MKIHQKLNLGFLSILGPIIFISLLAVWLIEDRLGRVSDFHSPTLFSIQIISSGTGNAIQESFAYVISGDTHEKEDFLLWQAEIAGQLEAFQRTAALGELGEEAEKALFDRIGSGVGLIIDEARNMFDAYESTGSVDAEVFTRYEAVIDQTFQALDALIEIERTEVTDSEEAALAVISLSENIVIVMLILGLVLTFVSARVIARFISRPLTQLRTASQALAQGDLDWKLEAASKDELGDLTHSFRHMAEQLKKSRDELEAQVRSRTLELQTTVEKLQEEVLVRMRAEDAMRESEKNLSLIYDTVGNVLYQIGVEPGDTFRFLSVNQAFLDATGFTEEHIVGKRVDEVIPEPSLSLVLGKYKQAIEQNRSVKWEETSVYPSGEKTGDVTITPALNEEGVCTHLIGSVHDITERLRAEQEIRSNAERFERWKASNFIGILQSNAEGGISDANDTLLAMLGYTKQDLVEGNLDWATLTPPEFLHLDKTAMEEAADKGYWTPFEKEYFLDFLPPLK